MPLEPALHSFNYCIDYLGHLLADVAPADAVAQPPGILNHPAWVLGHLAHTCEMLAGATGTPPWLPADFAGRFGAGSVPRADAALYEPPAQAMMRLRDAQARLARAIRELSPEQLDAPFPEPSLRDVFPTMRHAIVQVLAGHTAYHVGQVAVWRKAMGLPGIGRSFE